MIKYFRTWLNLQREMNQKNTYTYVFKTIRFFYNTIFKEVKKKLVFEIIQQILYYNFPKIEFETE